MTIFLNKELLLTDILCFTKADISLDIYFFMYVDPGFKGHKPHKYIGTIIDKSNYDYNNGNNIKFI